MFGVQVPSRLTFQSRSNSDSNIRMKLFTDSTSKKTEDQENPTAENEQQGAIQVKNDTPQVDGALENQVVNSLPPEKVPVMVNYLASLPMSEEDDQGIMVPSPSDSGSPFSSPLLTPPDIEGMQLMLKEFQEAEKDRLEKEKGFENNEGKDHLAIPHARAGRTVSLPTTTHPLSTEVYPRNTSIPYISGDSCDLKNEEIIIPEGEVKITLTQSVNERVREIEKKNVVPLRSERPASAGSRKCQSSGMSMASSEDSLFNTKRGSCLSNDDNGINNKIHSPLSSSIPEQQDGGDSDGNADVKGEMESSPKPSNTSSILNSTCDTTIEMSTDDYSAVTTPPLPPTCDQDREYLRAMRSESPPLSSCSSGLCLMMDQDTSEYDDIQVPDEDKMEDSSPDDTDPAKAYKLAQKRSFLLTEKKNRLKNTDLSETGDDSVSKGVKKLQEVFGESKQNSSRLKRTQSLKEERPLLVHKRTPSVNISIDVTTSND